MRDYSKVSPRFWTGDTGKQIRKLGPQAQVVAFYLFTCPSANMIGLYYIGLPTLCHETGSPLQGALKALRSLSEVGFAHYDLPSEHVYLPNMAREQIGERLQKKDNRHIAVLKELDQLRKTPYFKPFIERYRDAFELQDLEISPLNGSPLEAPSEPLRSQKQEQEQKQEEERARVTRPAKPPPRKRCPEDFEISEGMRQWAVEKAPDVDLAAETEKFRDWEYKSAKTDWIATWRTWMRRAQETAKPKSQHGGKPDGLPFAN